MRVFKALFAPIERLYRRYERPFSSISLIGGFVFDALTLRRVDALWENVWVGFHLLVVAVAIILLNIDEDKKEEGEEMPATHFWLVNILQFFFGGLLSTFIVFYFRSATLSATWPFLLILALAFLANERLKRHYERLAFQVALFFLSLFSFAIFSVPILFHRIGATVFVGSGLISLLIMGVFFFVLKQVSPVDYRKERKFLVGIVLGIFAAVNIMYFTNLIPPLPLALKGGGVYHTLLRNGANYEVTYEEYGWKGFFKIYDDVHLLPNDSVYAYSAVFSPSKLDIGIVHEWQHYNEASKTWETKARIDLPVIGGREGGFRTYSNRYGLESGRWRVNVETSRGQIIGRLLFNVVPVTELPPLTKDTLA
ncbi:MAG: hypothetical protein JWN89_369 [Parcubacteria group bacterium]|nr:hypothetical protein [Parcubacteria group bacterium]